MIYLDYSATTFPSDEVLDEFTKSAKEFCGNPNSSHNLGERAKNRIDEATNNIAKILNVKPSEIIYTSGSSEANNLAIKGVCKANNGKHIITTMMEHSSVIAPINRLCQDDYDVSFVKLNSDGTVNLDDLEKLIKDDTVLVSIVAVDSELGIKQNIDEIGRLLKKYPNVFFHVDATQMIGKTDFNFENVDLFSFSAHKFFGIKGVGCLVKKDYVKIIPQIDGGSSTTKFRSGTPALELIISLETALNNAVKNLNNNKDYIKKINNDIKRFLLDHKTIVINNTEKSIDQIINFSIPNRKKLYGYLNDHNIYVSTKSACSSSDALSKTIMAIYNDKKRAEESIRISISYTTTEEEIDEFKKVFEEYYRKYGD